MLEYSQMKLKFKILDAGNGAKSIRVIREDPSAPYTYQRETDLGIVVLFPNTSLFNDSTSRVRKFLYRGPHSFQLSTDEEREVDQFMALLLLDEVCEELTNVGSNLSNLKDLTLHTDEAAKQLIDLATAYTVLEVNPQIGK